MTPSYRPGHGNAGRAVLVSGGTSGLGLAAARRLCEEGAAVWVLGSSAASLAGESATLPLAGAGACDVSDPDAVDAAVGAAVTTMGKLDAVFVNAGIDGQGVPTMELDAKHFRRVLDVNVVGAFLVARAAARVLARPGAIVFNASVNALRPERAFADYNASKAAVVSLAKTMAIELSGDGIAVTAISPGYFPTRMTAPYLADEGERVELLAQIPAGRLGDPAEVAALVSFLISHEAAYLTGGVITIDGGRSA